MDDAGSAGGYPASEAEGENLLRGVTRKRNFDAERSGDMGRELSA